MTIKEILEIENANTDRINLFKEGIFWRAYERSAMRLVNNLKTLKINRKYVKKVEQDIFYCGFPDSSLEEIKKKTKEKEFVTTQQLYFATDYTDFHRLLNRQRRFSL